MREASAHFCIDNDSIVQCVDERLIAWHAPGANTTGIGVELSGYASQTTESWFDSYSLPMLKLAADYCAKACARWKIPVEYVDVDGLKRGEAGITTHDAVSKAFRKSDHYDPGKGFPMAQFIEMVRGVQ